MTETPPALPGRGKQFSLATLLLVIVIVGAGIGIYVTSQNVHLMQGEVYFLREDAGYLNFGDRNKIWARNIDLDDSFRWRWRVLIPKEGHYRIFIRTENIVAPTIRPLIAKSIAIDLSDEDNTIEAVLVPGENGVAKLHLNAPHISTSIDVATNRTGFEDLLVNPGFYSSLHDRSDFFHSDEPLELISIRARPILNADEKKPVHGLRVWIEQDTEK